MDEKELAIHGVLGYMRFTDSASGIIHHLRSY